MKYKIYKRTKFLLITSVIIFPVICFAGMTFAARGTLTDCTNDDKNLFPYGFLCGSMIRNPLNAPLSTDVSNDGGPYSQLYRGNGNDGNGQFKSVPANTEITFTTGWNASGPPKREGKAAADRVITWVILDIPSSLYSNITDKGGGTLTDCPGVNGAHRVFNYQGGGGPDASPVAYNPNNGEGIEDCQSEGKTLYWISNGSNSSPEYTFKIKVGNRDGTELCIRENISVAFDSDASSGNQIWPRFFNDQNVNAAHVAKQSVRKCFRVTNASPEGDINNATCTNISVRAYDRDPTRRTEFYVVRENASGSGTSPVLGDRNNPIYPSNTDYNNYNADLKSAFNAQSSVTFIVWAKDIESGDWVQVDSGSQFSASCAQPVFGCDYVEVNYNQPGYQMSIKAVDSQGNTLAAQNAAYQAGETNVYHKDFEPYGKTVNVQIKIWTGAGPGATFLQNSNQDFNCYDASCQISSVIGDGPGGKVLPGGQYTVEYTFTNNLDRELPIKLLEHALSRTDRTGPNPLSLTLDKKQTITRSYSATAPLQSSDPALANKPFYFNTGDKPEYVGLFDLGASCGKDVAVYRNFSIDLLPAMSLDDPEDPTNFTYSAKVKVTSPNPINIGVTSTVSRPNGIEAGPVYTTGPYSNGETYTINSTTSTNIVRPLVAGQQYCTSMTADSNAKSGLIGPGGPNDTYVTGTGTVDPACSPVSNKPYFKVYGSGVSVGSDFNKIPGCGTTDGVLGGFFKYGSDPSLIYTWGRGSSVAWQALAKGNNYGVASRQVDAYKSPTELTFASPSTAVGQDNADVQFGNPYLSAPCLEEPVLDNSTIVEGLPGNTIGNLTLTGGDKKIIKTTGNVYINGDITYAGNVSQGNAPDFQLITTGNIYIAPGVKDLYGKYYAVPTNATSSDGRIYTCAKQTGAYSDIELYNNCSGNQLVVHGNFVARKVVLSRTYGSLRDEKPVAGAPGNPGGAIKNGITQPLKWYDTPTASQETALKADSHCEQIDEPSEPRGWDWKDQNPANNTPNNPSDTGWQNNYLCLDSADYDKGIQLAWSNGGPGSPKPSGADVNCSAKSVGQVITESGYGTDPFAWTDNYLCVKTTSSGPKANVEVLTSWTNPSTTNRICTEIRASGDNHANSIWDLDAIGARVYFCVDKYVGGTPTPVQKPVAQANLKCSVPAGAGGLVATSQGTCAAEIFRYNPSQYLAKPIPGTSGDNAIIFDSITSLPPVL